MENCCIVNVVIFYIMVAGMKNKFFTNHGVPILLVLVFAFLGFSGLFHFIELAFFDKMLYLTPTPKEDPHILLVDVDDATIDPHTGISTWPLPREYYGQALLTMKEYGAKVTLFDIEFIGQSQLEFAPTDFTENFTSPIESYLNAINSNETGYLATQISNYIKGSLSRSEFIKSVEDVVHANGDYINQIKKLLQNFSVDKDIQLGNGARVMQDVYFAGNMRELDETINFENRWSDFYENSAAQILYLVEDAPELLLGEVLKLLNFKPLQSTIAKIAPILEQADSSTDLEGLINEYGKELPSDVRELISNPLILALFYETHQKLKSIALPLPSGELSRLKPYQFIEMPTQVALQQAAGMGFSNVVIDKDGSRRRINLIANYCNYYIPQLAFCAIYNWYDQPAIDVSKKAITLTTKDGQRIKIPIDSKGEMLINWPHKRYMGLRTKEGEPLPGRKGLDSFKHIPFIAIHNTVALESSLENLLYSKSQLPEYDYIEWEPILTLFDSIAEVRQTILQGDLSSEEEATLLTQYKDMKQYLDNYLIDLSSPQILSILQSEIESGSYSETELEEMRALQQRILECSSELDSWLSVYLKSRQLCADYLPNAICIVGFTASSTTDFGVNPFQEDYPNVGTHAAIINTILQQNFLRQLPFWVGVVIALIALVCIYYLFKNLAPHFQIIAFISTFLVLALTSWLSLLLFGLYIPIFFTLTALFITFLIMVSMRFISVSKEKGFIRKAFSHYLSSDVINEIMKNPEKLKLGGDSRYMSAIFTDVKGFSTISEKLTPVELVHLLNDYLSVMSDIVLELRGLIDKYEGDAIIAFFNAPNDLPDHAYLACLSAIRMRRAEKALNERFLKEKMSPTPLLTRIGINTGEMVVGNMGTSTKMNYTMMGSSVNLAARLEGVNKQYGTWILISDETYKAGGNRLFCRKIDRVRVVGIHEPVLLWEVIEEKENVSREVVEGVNKFHIGLDYYNRREWSKAIEAFNQTLTYIPEDPPSIIYIQRCELYLKREPAKDWDMVTNLTSK